MLIYVDGVILQDAADSLSNAFRWASTNPNSTYWSDVYDELVMMGVKSKNPTSNLKEDEVDIFNCKKFIYCLNNAFTWTDSPQGVDYWLDVETKMWRIIRGEKAKNNPNPFDAYDRAMKGVG